jgi:hypothetical protein
MTKTEAIRLLGGTPQDDAAACRVSASAVSQWPDELTKDQIDRVQAALYRQSTRQSKRRTKAVA